MFGVVLWSDAQAQSAVIWCEDHGDLAFYKRGERAGSEAFDAGDWVQFDVTLESEQRFAVNPRLVAEGLYPELADRLSEVSPTATPTASPTGASLPRRRREPAIVSPRRIADVIPFGRRSAGREPQDTACAQPA